MRDWLVSPIVVIDSPSNLDFGGKAVERPNEFLTCRTIQVHIILKCELLIKAAHVSRNINITSYIYYILYYSYITYQMYFIQILITVLPNFSNMHIVTFCNWYSCTTYKCVLCLFFMLQTRWSNRLVVIIISILYNGFIPYNYWSVTNMCSYKIIITNL